MGVLKAQAEKVLKIESWLRQESEVFVVTNDVKLSMKVWALGGLVISRDNFIKWLGDYVPEKNLNA